MPFPRGAFSIKNERMAFMRAIRPLLLFFGCGLFAALPLASQEITRGFAGQNRSSDFPLLIGAKDGLYGLDPRGNLTALWQGGEVRKIVVAEGGSWALLTSAGVLWSADLFRWEERNRGLPVKTVKLFQNGEKSFLPMVQELKDLKTHPGNPSLMVCATKDTVYLSQDAGRSWANLGMPSYRTNGIKAVATAYLPDLTVFLSHSTYGIHYLQPDKPSAKWTELNDGIEKLETTDNADEIADIVVVQATTDAKAQVYASQTFRRRLYALNWEQKRFSTLWADTSTESAGTVDSLNPGATGLRFIMDGAVAEIDYPQSAYRERGDILEIIRGIPVYLGIDPLCLITRPEWTGMALGEDRIALSELWLLFDRQNIRPQAVRARGREGLYLPVNHAMERRTLTPYLDIIAQRELDMVVIDMKDDYGRLRFEPRNPEISAKGRVSRPLDIDSFLKEMKERGIYTAARVVVFKDPALANREGGKYAVVDSRTGKPWAGYYDTRRRKTTAEAQAAEKRESPDIEILPASDPDYEILRSYYDERWVDPYSEEVWDYIADIAEELHQRGFDEIQFDYIRFPTDGVNLGDARYRWQDRGMDMESAILSFLRHIRSRIEAPISIDIYGANGWYRTGARTGQEVELLSQYVDVICPMYYPSHFEQDFLAQAPAELRPYRIYYLGTQRTTRIGRGRIIVRPYVQAFFLNVSYDRKYYDLDYVRRQVEGVRDSGRGGLTYWNNSGRYEDIPQPAAIKVSGTGGE
jgi:hypothetical protein